MKKATKSKSQTRRVAVQKKSAKKKRAPRVTKPENVDKNLNAGDYIGELDIKPHLAGDLRQLAKFVDTSVGERNPDAPCLPPGWNALAGILKRAVSRD